MTEPPADHVPGATPLPAAGDTPATSTSDSGSDPAPAPATAEPADESDRPAPPPAADPAPAAAADPNPAAAADPAATEADEPAAAETDEPASDPETPAAEGKASSDVAPEGPAGIADDGTAGHASQPVAAATAIPRRGSAIFAALLSTLIPGLGQLWAGRRRRAALVAAPFVVLLACLVLLGVGVATHSIDDASMLAFLLRPGTLFALLALDGLFLVYRLAAIVDAWRLARRRWPAARDRVMAATSIALLVVLMGVNVGVHAYVGYLDTAVSDLDSSALGGDSGPDALLPPDETFPPDETASPTPGGGGGGGGPVLQPPSAGPIVTPVPGPAWMRDGRLNVLLLGVDAGPGRSGIRTDTMILASVDVATGRAALFGIPRNLLNVPLPPESQDAFPACHCFPMLLNALYTYAYGHSNLFPGGNNRGYRAVAGAIETLTGVRLDGVAIIDLNGFVDMIDALGGLRITIPQAIFDDHYPKPDGTGDIQIYIPAGRQRLNGIKALEYARSRHSSSDYSRMRRQQAVLIALRAQLQPCNVLNDLPKLLRALKDTVQTTFTPDDLPDLLRLAARVNPDRILEFSFDPPDYPEFLAKADITRIRTLVRHVFDPKSSGGSGASPTPSPTANPFPTPIDDPCSKD